MTFAGQDGFASLSFSSWQHDGLMQARAGHESLSGMGSSTKSNKRPFDDDVSIPGDVKEEVIMMVAALEACELSRTDAQNAGDNMPAMSTNDDSIFEPMRSITNLGPPKKFHRRGALWASITRRMLRLARIPLNYP
jgi:hypothetical protein